MKESCTKTIRKCIEDYAEYLKRNLRADYSSKTINIKQYNSITERIDYVLETINSGNMSAKDYRRLVEYMIGLKDMYDMIFGNL